MLITLQKRKGNVCMCGIRFGFATITFQVHVFVSTFQFDFFSNMCVVPAERARGTKQCKLLVNKTSQCCVIKIATVLMK